MGQWRRDRRTYIEVGRTVKTILIGHYAERETGDSRRREGERTKRSSGRKAKANKKGGGRG